MKNPSSSLVIELYDLKVSPKSKKQFGRVVTTQTLSEDDIIRRIAERGCELHPSTIKAALENTCLNLLHSIPIAVPSLPSHEQPCH